MRVIDTGTIALNPRRDCHAQQLTYAVNTVKESDYTLFQLCIYILDLY